MDFQGDVQDNRQSLGSSIVRDWPGLPAYLDAAITLADGTTLFFKDDRFYVFWNQMPREPTTGLIGMAFPHMPASKLDAAFMTNSSLVFVKGQEFFLFGIEQFPFVQRGNIVSHTSFRQTDRQTDGRMNDFFKG
jgi:Hemopexin